ncbi:serine/threonine-protein kinase pim-2-like isoform X3 [Thunnus maccoyii]|uniref:serine/threonine-protein kinase pim-2-like isoform X3 n=1 Tax=Thunnus maccoyii TaxID=8240 RepID=UPI001C4A82C5|nr:serine/threonine-protein kinase pim-2-like isoform X3 [Thunnus maccoyii]
MSLVRNVNVMSSTSTQKFMTPSSGKDRENNMDFSVRKRGREDSDVAPMKKIKVCNITQSTEPCNKVQEGVNPRKRRASHDGKMPGKKMRPSEGSVKNYTRQWGKREASVDAGTSAKRMRCSDSTSITVSTPTESISTGSSMKSSSTGSSMKSSSTGSSMKSSSTGSSIKSSSTGSSMKSISTGSSMKSSSTESITTGSSSTASSATVSSEKVIISHIFNNVSLEEQKVFELASSGSTSRAEFEDKYVQQAPIGQGGFGSVYAGFRKEDSLPVAIKHVPRDIVRRERVVCNGKVYYIILEVALMLKTAGLPGSDGQSAAISLLDWYALEHELILVLERPAYSLDLHKYLQINGGSLPEHEAKMILSQLVDAAIDMHAKGVFHRDIKLENTLIQRSPTGAPRIRLIDFGCGSFSTETSYDSFCGTRAYVPPEWFDCNAYWAHPTTVWQLGALFYSLLNGREYFTTEDFIQNHIRINSALSRDTKILLYMCLARDSMERATLQELQSFLAFTQPSPPPI